MNRFILLILAAGLMTSCAHVSGPKVPQTVRAEREKFKTNLIYTTIEGNLSKPFTHESEGKYEDAFWGMAMARYKSDTTTRAIHEAFSQWTSLSPSFQRMLLEIVYTLYPEDFLSEADMVLKQTKNEKLFAMASLQILRVSNWKDSDRISEEMQRRFPHHDTNPILHMLSIQMRQESAGGVQARPPVADLLSAPYEQGAVVIFSIQRKDRRFEGRAVVRDADGHFVKVSSHKYFSIPQLAMAGSDLPGYLSNGNTPQGIFSIHGFNHSPNVFIGPTENLAMKLPYEAKPFEYFHTTSQSDLTWTRERYENLLPDTWRNFQPFYTAYYAGEAGRFDILAHGTTVDPDFYKGEPYYPNAPTLGCLSAGELWSPRNGERVKSNQQKLMDVLHRIGYEKGYVVVIELNNEMRRVTFDDIQPLLAEADGKVIR